MLFIWNVALDVNVDGTPSVDALPAGVVATQKFHIFQILSLITANQRQIERSS